MGACQVHLPAWGRVLGIAALALVVACGENAGPAPDPPVETEATFVAALASAYEQKDLDRFESFLSNAAGENAVFTFKVTDVSGTTQSTWDYDTEVSIHRRMFRPEEIPPSDPALDPKLWLGQIDATLTPNGDFVERNDLYSSEANPSGVDPTRFRVTSAAYTTFVAFLPQGSQFVVDGDAEFVVIEDLTKDAGDLDRFRLLSWSDRCPVPSLQSNECWSTVKMLYAK